MRGFDAESASGLFHRLGWSAHAKAEISSAIALPFRRVAVRAGVWGGAPTVGPALVALATIGRRAVVDEEVALALGAGDNDSDHGEGSPSGCPIPGCWATTDMLLWSYSVCRAGFSVILQATARDNLLAKCRL